MSIESAPLPSFRGSGAYQCVKCRASIDESPAMVEMLIITSRSRKTRIWCCVSCMFGEEAMEHPAITGSIAAVQKQKATDEKHKDAMKASVKASRFDNEAPVSAPQNDFIADDTPKGRATEPTSSEFVPQSSIAANLGVANPDVVDKLRVSMEIPLVDHDGVPSIKKDDFDNMAMEIRKRVAARNAKKYGDEELDDGRVE